MCSVNDKANIKDNQTKMNIFVSNMFYRNKPQTYTFNRKAMLASVKDNVKAILIFFKYPT